MKGLVSIVVLFYNIKDYLFEAIHSLVNQSYEKIEIIVVGDGSTDVSSELCDSIQSKDKQIRAIHKPNSGMLSARNIGIKVAIGEYITLHS